MRAPLPGTLFALTAFAAFGVLAEPEGRHGLRIQLDGAVTDTRSTLGAWTDGGAGKLRHDSRDSDYGYSRLALEYAGRLAPELYAHAVLDYIDNADTKSGLTEAYLEWRPVPSGLNRNRFRFGAFYPPLSLENSDFAWESPYSRSFSAINAWLGEEIRPIGADWKLTRTLGGQGSPHEIGFSAGAFIGNDPAATLLFWRGWAVHDRQTRLNERLPLPSFVFANPQGGPDFVIPRRLDPIAEIDDRPGVMTSVEWSYARRARLSFGFYDNRADPYAFRDGQWAWGTRFHHLGAQVELPAGLGLVAEFMQGDTDWLTFTGPNGSMTPATELITDEFEAAYLLLSRPFGDRHRLSLRRDQFSMARPGSLQIDDGDALTLSYRFSLNPRVGLEVEWLEINSERELWPIVYNQPATSRTESQIQLGFELVLFDNTD